MKHTKKPVGKLKQKIREKQVKKTHLAQIDRVYKMYTDYFEDCVKDGIGKKKEYINLLKVFEEYFREIL